MLLGNQNYNYMKNKTNFILQQDKMYLQYIHSLTCQSIYYICKCFLCSISVKTCVELCGTSFVCLFYVLHEFCITFLEKGLNYTACNHYSSSNAVFLSVKWAYLPFLIVSEMKTQMFFADTSDLLLPFLTYPSFSLWWSSAEVLQTKNINTGQVPNLLVL